MQRDDELEHFDRHFEKVEKRESRQERKRASRKDRSRYKFTDQKKKEEISKSFSEGERGRIVSISSAGITVDRQKERFLCTLRGALKEDFSRKKNLVAVGDWVYFQELADQEGSIVAIEERSSVLSRADNLSRNKEHLIAANVDQVFITVSVVEPSLKPGLVDRYLIAAQKGGMDPVVLVNKIELLQEDKEQKALFEEFLQGYESQGITVIGVSAKTGEGIDVLSKKMQEKTSVFSGQSGVGKSTLISLVTGVHLATSETVARTKKGAHTTTKAEIIPVEGNGWCVDTPGIKSFGVWELSLDEVIEYFPELFSLRQQCRYPNCQHRGEKGCVIEQAIEKGEIHLIRYQSYISLLESIEQPHKRR